MVRWYNKSTPSVLSLLRGLSIAPNPQNQTLAARQGCSRRGPCPPHALPLLLLMIGAEQLFDSPCAAVCTAGVGEPCFLSCCATPSSHSGRCGVAAAHRHVPAGTWVRKHPHLTPAACQRRPVTQEAAIIAPTGHATCGLPGDYTARACHSFVHGVA